MFNYLNEIMKNKNILYITIALVTYVLFISFPTYLFVKEDPELYYIIEIILRTVYLVFIVLFSIFTKLAKSYTGKIKWMNMLFLLPLFFVAFFNIFYLRITGSSIDSLGKNISNVFYSEGVNTYEILRFAFIIITVVEEEILFRFLLQKNLSLGHKFVRIAITAAVFAVCHFFTILYDGYEFVFANPLQLLEIFFVFGIGIILGVLFEYSNSILYSMAFNMLYSLGAGIYEIVLTNQSGYKIYLTSALFALGAAAYICLFYFVILKKEQR